MKAPNDKKRKKLVRIVKTFCTNCLNYTDGTCKQTGKKSCRFMDQHIYRAVITIPGTKARRMKNLNTTDYAEALKLAEAFLDEVLNGKPEIQPEVPQKEEQKEFPPKQPEIESNPQPTVRIQPIIPEPPKDEPPAVLLKHALARYAGWIRGEAPSHLKKDLSRDYAADITNSLLEFSSCLANNGYDLDTLALGDDAGWDKMVGHFYDHLNHKKGKSGKGIANRQFNKQCAFMSGFLTWAIDQYDQPRRDYFSRIQRRSQQYNPVALTDSAYHKLINYDFTPENGRGWDGTKWRYYYKPWFRRSLEILATVGRRREEVCEMKYSSVIEEDGKPVACKIIDRKVTNIKKLKPGEEKICYVPITPDLWELLKDGYEHYKATGEDAYVIAPELQDRAHMPDDMTRAFTFYAKQIGIEGFTLKSIRKAYLNAMNIETKGQAHLVSGHSGPGILESNYIDGLAVAKSVASSDFKVFQQSERKAELEQIREQSQEKSNNKSIDHDNNLHL